MQLIKKDSPILKSQNQISAAVKANAVSEIQAWLASFGLSPYQSALLAEDLINKAISERIQKTAASAPDILLTDADKLESLTMIARRTANALDEAEQLDVLLAELEKVDAWGEGNSL